LLNVLDGDESVTKVLRAVRPGEKEQEEDDRDRPDAVEELQFA
jgi:hypothetical protein